MTVGTPGGICVDILFPSLQPQTQETVLLDLLGGVTNMQTEPSTTLLPPSTSTSTTGGGGALLDLLDLTVPQQPAAAPVQAPGQTSGTGDLTAGLLDLLGEGGGTTQPETGKYVGLCKDMVVDWTSV